MLLNADRKPIPFLSKKSRALMDYDTPGTMTSLLGIPVEHI